MALTERASLRPSARCHPPVCPRVQSVVAIADGVHTRSNNPVSVSPLGVKRTLPQRAPGCRLAWLPRSAHPGKARR
jgi:hypothetical protein